MYRHPGLEHGSAAALAKTGAEIANLTYRKEYVEDPGGQWQGYKDADTDRAWGVDEWSRRAGQGALVNWVAANALLPAVWVQADRSCDPAIPVAECPSAPADPEIGQIDRASVPELDEIAAHYAEIESGIDSVNAGLNPLGLAKGVVPFDIDPSRVDAGETHFEQVYARAKKALTNTVAVFDHANRLSQSLRRNQDTLDDFAGNVDERERDFVNRLIEIFGTPYTDDIGGTGTFPSGYNGPDLYHYMYVDRFELEGRAPGQSALGRAEIRGFFKKHKDLGYSPIDSDGFTTEDGLLVVDYEVDPELGLVKPPEWTGDRLSPGELQRVLSDKYRAQAAFDQAVKAYDNKVKEFEGAASLFLNLQNSVSDTDDIMSSAQGKRVGLAAAIGVAKAAAIAFARFRHASERIADFTKDGLPTIVGFATDPFAAVRTAINAANIAGTSAWGIAEDLANVTSSSLELEKEGLSDQTQYEILTQSNEVQIEKQIREVERFYRELPVLHLEAV